MSQRLWPATGSTPKAIRQALIDRIVQATLEYSEDRSNQDKGQKESKHREQMIEALFLAAAAEVEKR
jgi:hypothetical protein